MAAAAAIMVTDGLTQPRDGFGRFITLPLKGVHGAVRINSKPPNAGSSRERKNGTLASNSREVAARDGCRCSCAERDPRSDSNRERLRRARRMGFMAARSWPLLRSRWGNALGTAWTVLLVVACAPRAQAPLGGAEVPARRPAASALGAPARVLDAPHDDTDDDGVPDALDHCPREPGRRDDTDSACTGCPWDACPGRPGPIDGDIEVVARVPFAQASATLGPNATEIVDSVGAALKDHPEIAQLEIEGHAARNELNSWSLSQDRARAVVGRLVARGIDPPRLVVRAYGASRAMARSNAGSASNRCVSFHAILRPDDASPRDAANPNDGGRGPDPMTRRSLSLFAAAEARADAGRVYPLGDEPHGSLPSENGARLRRGKRRVFERQRERPCGRWRLSGD